ncbi:MAG TPA: BON domain-containing protein [Kofleriaceae bacterium]|nr:BON domain-containing protein [Kofleriaceae bacterium]
MNERYRERYGMRDQNDGDRERSSGRFGRGDEDRGRDDDRMRYQGTGGQSGSQSGNMSSDRNYDRMGDNMYRQQTGFRGEEMYDRERGSRYGGNRQNFDQEDFSSEQRGYGGGFGGQRMGPGGQRFGGGSSQLGGYGGGGGGMGMGGMGGGGEQDWQRRQEWQGGQGGGQYEGGGQQGGGMGGQQDWQRSMQDRQRGQQGRSDWGTGARQDYDRDRDYGGTLGHVDRSYGQQRGSQYGTSGPFGGGHRGKGPSGYARSDERIREEVCDALSDDDHVDASNIEIQVKNGEVTLSGTVPDRRSKRMAEDCIEHVRGVKDVTNNIRVQDKQQEMSGQSGQGKTGSQSQSVSSSPEKDQDHSKRPRA